MKKQKFLLALSSALLPLVACGGEGGGSTSKSVPSTGFKMFKEKNAATLGSSDAVVYGNVQYAYITGNGTEDAGTLKGNVYYKIPYQLNVAGGLSKTYTTYAIYYSSSDLIVEDTKSGPTAYTYAVSLISDGALKGTLGNL